jgi:hypothetical protein
MAYVTDAALEFALKNVTNYGDSDFFPRPFDYRAITANWQEVKNHLLSIDIRKQQIFRPTIFAALKPSDSFRIVHQLDPLNHLIYTAATYMVAPAIEAKRPDTAAKIACSYRISVDDEKGGFFAANNGYQVFLARCAELAAEYPYVLVTDVADYYNQISLHRLASAIDYCDPDLHHLGQDIEWFIMELNDRTSKGIPVGPPASIVLAEANFIDVDELIIARGLVHTRYVDDFRIFAIDENSLRKLLEDLTKYLYDNHRLILATGKTNIISSEQFKAEYLESPEVVETQALHRHMTEFWSAVSDYEFDPENVNVPDPNDKEVKAATLRQMMTELCSRARLDLGLARRILRKSRKYRLRAILPQLLDNFDFFAAAVTDVVLYLDKITTPAVAQKMKPQFLALLSTRAASYEHVRYWLEYFFALKYKLFRSPELDQFLSQGSVSNQALAALRSRGLPWIREQKKSVDALGRLDRREVIHASGILPPTERGKWLERLDRSSTDFLEKMTIRWVSGFK